MHHCDDDSRMHFSPRTPMARLLRLCLIVMLALAPLAATAAERVALVIGMAQYQTVGTLKNTVNDARRIAATLEEIGFDVTTLIDAPAATLRNVVEDFAFRAETADLALIYYAGHGVEVAGENFLLPVDAQVQSNADVQRQSVSLKELLQAVDRARRMRIVILDSCRDNPLGGGLDVAAQAAAREASAGTRGGGGLAPAQPDRGTLVAFAARDGQVALDGDGANSPFAMALAEKMRQPGLEISLMFRQVRDRVLEMTHNLQEPHTYGSLSGTPFYLAGGEDAQVASSDRAAAWSAIRPDQEVQLAALAETGDTRSMLGLAYMRLNPEEKRFDPAKAVELFTRAADAGSPEAQFELAKLYERGIGVAPDPARALELYRAAADQDFADAINDLGFLYYQGGLGLPRDAQKALALFERAADLRHPQAMFNFAALIDDGLIPSKGPEDAAHYLYEALRSGSRDVYELLRERPTMFKDATRKALQAQLKHYDFYTGTIDGNFGPGTQRGIARAYGLSG
jgi:TPR repeat protein